MSNALYPTLAGLSWPIGKVAMFNNIIARAADLSELRGAFASTPVYSFTLSYDLLRDDTTNNELKTLYGFALARQGSFDSFLFLDADDSVATVQSFGTGDAVTTSFQLTRAMGAFVEQCSNIGLAPSIFVNGVLKTVTTDYTINGSGLVTFTSAPAAAAALTWTGTYYFRCRFNIENTPMGFSHFAQQLWELKTVEFLGSLGTKI